MGTAIIPGRETSPVLQPAECIFHNMPLIIQRIVKGKCFISAFSGGCVIKMVDAFFLEVPKA